ncbi:hypothetical protein BpHYR1_012326 [Brachionus plicatilis]|uniref:Uncharacterized protein n=1 Tax=Brachionus plicatilis TaxID=10195 RepID=A0A3M7RQ69_BRAPC|nr:hypothetical protein BpHYR1_012326 [Brachionus plicatilis]
MLGRLKSSLEKSKLNIRENYNNFKFFNILYYFGAVQFFLEFCFILAGFISTHSVQFCRICTDFQTSAVGEKKLFHFVSSAEQFYMKSHNKKNFLLTKILSRVNKPQFQVNNYEPLNKNRNFFKSIELSNSINYCDLKIEKETLNDELEYAYSNRYSNNFWIKTEYNKYSI